MGFLFINPFLIAAVRPSFIAEASTQNGSSSTLLVINKPTGTVDGDLMIAVMGTNQTSAMTWTGDTGWTEVVDHGTGPALRVAWKIASSEGASYTFTCSSSTALGGSILTYRGTHQTVPISVTGVADRDTTAATGTTLTAAGVTVPGNTSVLLAAFYVTMKSTTLSAPTGMASRSSNSDATFQSWNIFDEAVESGATGDRVSTITTAELGDTGEMVLFAIAPP